MSKIVTINIPVSWIAAINKLIGPESLHASRSELIRCAVKKSLKTHILDSKANTSPPAPVDPNEIERLEKVKINDLVKESIEEAQNNQKLQLL